MTPVRYIIKDLNGKEIVCGPGVTMAKSIIEMVQRMNILASARIADDIRTLMPEYETILHPVRDYLTKTGQKVLIYNVYGVCLLTT